MQQSLTRAQAQCTRYAFTDGQCVAYGCHNCPGCGEIEAKVMAAPRSDDRWIYLILAIACLAFAVCWQQGMARQEHAEQIADRV